jgi:exosortase
MTREIPTVTRPIPVSLLVAVATLGGSLLWASAPTVADMAHRWWHDPQYSHGYLVPIFAGVLLWLRREHLAKVTYRPRWSGLWLILAGSLFSLLGAYLYFDALNGLALLPCIAGLFVLLGGWPALRWAWPAVAFLAFMLPLPHSVERGLAGPLQSLATLASTYTLQTLGFPALAEGNVILVNETKVEVAQACSGLSMLLIFFALSTAVALVIQRPLLDRLLIVVSAIPIAVISNVTRITVTAILHEKVSSEWANMVFHDVAGWLMMVWGLALLWLELWVLSRLLIEPQNEPQLLPMRLVEPAPARPRSRKADAEATTT